MKLSILDETSIAKLPTISPQIVGMMAPIDCGVCRCAGIRLTLHSFCAVGDMYSLIFDSDIYTFDYILSFYVTV